MYCLSWCQQYSIFWVGKKIQWLFALWWNDNRHMVPPFLSFCLHKAVWVCEFFLSSRQLSFQFIGNVFIFSLCPAFHLYSVNLSLLRLPSAVELEQSSALSESFYGLHKKDHILSMLELHTLPGFSCLCSWVLWPCYKLNTFFQDISCFHLYFSSPFLLQDIQKLFDLCFFIKAFDI